MRRSVGVVKGLLSPQLPGNSIFWVSASRHCASSSATPEDGSLPSLKELNATKASRVPQRGVDLDRAFVFVKQNKLTEARQAVLEELRWFPHDNQAAKSLLRQLNSHLAPMLNLPKQIISAEPEFAMCYEALKDHTMLTPARLLSLWLRVKKIEQSGIEGDIIECGSAGGGSGVLLALAARHFSSLFHERHSAGEKRRKRRRRVFLCDTFSGMPDATPSSDVRVSDGVEASATAWGAGTCSAPPEHIERLCRRFSLETSREYTTNPDRDVVLVQGLFEGTLPRLVDSSGNATTAAPITSIALLHADADWYESTKTIFETVYPLVVPREEASGGGGGRGQVQLDDFHHWGGCRKAFDEYFDDSVGRSRPQLQEIDGIAVAWEK